MWCVLRGGPSLFSWPCDPLFLLSVNRDVLKNRPVNRDSSAFRETWTPWSWSREFTYIEENKSLICTETTVTGIWWLDFTFLWHFSALSWPLAGFLWKPVPKVLSLTCRDHPKYRTRSWGQRSIEGLWAKTSSWFYGTIEFYCSIKPGGRFCPEPFNYM